MSFSVLFNKFNCQIHKHFITEDLEGEIDYGGATDYVYALEGTKILDATAPGGWVGVNNCHVKMAVNEYGKGRSFYITGLPYSAQNAKLLYRAILWTAGKEDMDKKSYCTNPLTESHFYGDRYAITNNTSVEQTTIFYDMTGNATEIALKPYEIRWIKN